MNAPLLRVEGLRTWLDTGAAPVRAVDGVSFEIGRGETLALVGESGCGKSMTALSLMRLLPDGGQVIEGRALLDGVDLLALPEARMREVRGARAAMIFQEPGLSLNPVMTVGEQVAEALRRHGGLQGTALAVRVVELLEAVRIPDAMRRAAAYPAELSGGMKQRVVIAMALACDPQLVIADEPTTALDVTIQAQVLDLLRELQSRRGTAMLLITHDLAVVAGTAQRVAVMYAGEIVEIAPAERFFAAAAHPYSRKLFEALPGRTRRGVPLAVIGGAVPSLSAEFAGCRFADRCDSATDACRSRLPQWHELASGHEVRCHLYADGAAGGLGSAVPVAATAAGATTAFGEGEPRLVVEDLQVHFPVRKGLFRRTVAQVRAVDGVSLAISAGRTLGLVGESGCGKTTVGKAILRLVEPTGGRVLLRGEDLARLSRRELRSRRREAQIIFQDPYASLDPRMRVSEILEEGMLALGVGADAPDRQRRIDRLLAEVGLAPELKLRYPHEFSGGQRQRIAIARALAVEPDLVVCDEPTSALDVSVQAQILNLLRSLQEARGLAYLFITHNLAVVEYLAHEIAVMYLGRIVEHGLTDEVLASPRHPYTRALLAAVPVADPGSRREVIRLAGDLPSPLAPPAGCAFHPRCPEARPECAQRAPASVRFGATHSARCLLYE